MNTESPVDEEPKYKRSLYCEETIQAENMPNSIRWKEKI